MPLLSLCLYPRGKGEEVFITEEFIPRRKKNGSKHKGAKLLERGVKKF